MKSRPRFSLRALVIVVTLMCLYFGAWEPTKRLGIGAVKWHVRHPVFMGPDGERVDRQGEWYFYDEPQVFAPFIVTVTRYGDVVVNPNGDNWSGIAQGREAYLWLFGFIYPRNVYYLQ